ncbi:uncharacterized protein LOC105165408 [Sesamum indicum]|uniref:Uncharacterized protein LOC105165408 n=1 Tax=Sesamum indicum TaxID=4182 RepID=A0A8M8USU0_SESIN|nr:uncharacterized protein LOC105165408 [Sesamum indicum]XP_020549999.1 uncharacterized protein LOC105165408 [Sesamum indicum]
MACRCRPLAFLIGLPFGLVALAFAIVGAVIWFIAKVFTCCCPCCICWAGIVNVAAFVVKLPVKVIRWFVDKIPC